MIELYRTGTVKVTDRDYFEDARLLAERAEVIMKRSRFGDSSFKRFLNCLDPLGVKYKLKQDYSKGY